jgi:hypothetical protein
MLRIVDVAAPQVELDRAELGQAQVALGSVMVMKAARSSSSASSMVSTPGGRPWKAWRW